MKMYQIFAFISMLFAGLTSVVAKVGLKNVSGDTGLAVRTSFVFLFIWLNIVMFHSLKEFTHLTRKDIIFLGLSALTTSLSWIFYYKAIKIGNVSEVALIDKASIVLTLFLAIVFLREPLTWQILVGCLLILAGLWVLVLK
ncbi:MAG: EamA family transporter [Microscillaceae bacterium]|nr:EamA family transporter [Microscillaceae bacterium]MDW8460221.1 EamA family transporter [Cytophagales bacterium]